MKKFLLFLTFLVSLVIPFVGSSQVYTLPLAAGDTVSNTGTAAKVFTISGDYKGVVVNPVFTKIAGTVAGTIKLQGSLDGTTFTDVASQTFTATDIATGQTLWYVSAPLAQKYRVTWTGVGTMSAVLSVRYRVNK